jgi:hypothetical protein
METRKQNHGALVLRFEGSFVLGGSMRKHHLTRIGRLLLGATVLASISAPGAAQAGEWSFSAGADYTSGDYGEAQETTIYQVPLSTAYRGDNWSFAVTVPYVWLEGSGNIIPGSAGGGAGGGGGGASAGVGLGAGGIDLGVVLPSAGPTASPMPPAIPTTVEEEGLGDVNVSFAFAPFRPSNGGGLTIGVGARLPTGDEEKSLGAGQTIGSIGASYNLPISESFSLYAGAGYAHAFETEDGGMFGSVGANFDIGPNFNLGGGVDWAESTTTGFEDATNATVYAGFDLAARTRLVAYASAGLTNTSPETGAGLRLVFRP